MAKDHQGRPLASTDAHGAPVDGAAPARRMHPHDRERMILEGAVDFFAEHGFEGQLRQLAQRLGVSQPLIFRYFASKEILIERVYERTFLARWNPEWETVLADRARPLEERLVVFLKSYLAATDDSRWIRLSMLSSLAGHDLTRRYVEVHVTGLLRLIAREVRVHEGRDPDGEIGPIELELVWHLHSSAIYYLVRKHITKTPTAPDKDPWIAAVVNNFMRGLRRPGS